MRCEQASEQTVLSDCMHVCMYAYICIYVRLTHNDETKVSDVSHKCFILSTGSFAVASLRRDINCDSDLCASSQHDVLHDLFRLSVTSNSSCFPPRILLPLTVLVLVLVFWSVETLLLVLVLVLLLELELLLYLFSREAATNR